MVKITVFVLEYSVHLNIMLFMSVSVSSQIISDTLLISRNHVANVGRLGAFIVVVVIVTRVHLVENMTELGTVVRVRCVLSSTLTITSSHT